MRSALIFAPYILIPIFVTLIFKKYKASRSDWTYPITLLLVFFYPFLLFWIDDLATPPQPGPRCGNPP